MDVNLRNILIFSVILESIITYFKSFFLNSEFHLTFILSIIFGIIIAVCYDLDILSKTGIKSKISIIGNILTGILISRGSNFIYELVNNLNLQK